MFRTCKAGRVRGAGLILAKCQSAKSRDCPMRPTPQRVIMRLAIVLGVVYILLLSQPSDAKIVAIGAGLARSGSNSLKAALELLLDAESVSLEDLIGTPQLDNWIAAYKDRSNRTLLRSLVEGYASVTSLPGALLYKELMDEFPEVKVILTRHPKGGEAWYKSTMGTIWRLNFEIFNQTWLGQIPFVHRVHTQLREMYLDSEFMSYEQWQQKEAAIAKYKAWNERVEASVPADRLLAFSADQVHQSTQCCLNHHSAQCCLNAELVSASVSRALSTGLGASLQVSW